MCFLSINWDIRGLLYYLDPISRLYVLFLTVAAVWTISIPLRIAFRMRRTQTETAQSAAARITLSAWHRNLGQFFSLNLILFSGWFCNELFMGIRSEWFIRCNPNMDVIGPFDELLFVSLLGFTGLALVHCVRWLVLSKIEHVSERRI
jgi:hypothetical protein